MSVNVQCPSCERPLQVAEKFLGRQIRCPLCGQSFVPPGSQKDSSPAPPVPSLDEEDPRFEMLDELPTTSTEPPAEPTEAYSPELPHTRPPAAAPIPRESLEEPRWRALEEDDRDDEDRYERRRWRAEETVSAPAVALMIAGGFVFLVGICYGLLAALAIASPVRVRRGDLTDLLGGVVTACCVSIFGTATGPVVFAGGLQMKRLRMYTLAFAATIVAIIPLTPCWLLALPIGIWALIVLQKPGVKSMFR